MVAGIPPIGWDAYLDEYGVVHPGGAIQLLPYGTVTWEGGVGTLRMSCQKCHPDWTGNEEVVPDCDLCGGKGVKERIIKRRST